MFAFRNRRGTSIRLRIYDGQEYWLLQKRLSKGRFAWWPKSTSTARQLEAYEAQLLMVTGDLSRVRAAPMWRQSRTMAVPLSQLTAIDTRDLTREAIEDWHYWVALGYCF